MASSAADELLCAEYIAPGMNAVAETDTQDYSYDDDSGSSEEIDDKPAISLKDNKLSKKVNYLWADYDKFKKFFLFYPTLERSGPVLNSTTILFLCVDH